jgi:uncharacterized protein YbjQ (UPF0145 family)
LKQMIQKEEAALNGQQVRVNSVTVLDQEIDAFDLRKSPHGTTLTAQEVYVLEKAGYEVLNVVIGNIVYSMGIRGLLKSFQRAFTRGEMVDFTRMNRDARHIARNRMLEEAENLGATTVIDVVFETHEYADFLEITAMGTAVRKVQESNYNDPEIVVGS